MKILIVVLLSTLELLQKQNRLTENVITFPVPLKTPSSFPVTFGIAVSSMSSITLISFWTRTIYERWFQQIFWHNITNDRYSMSNQCPQPTTYQPRTISCPPFSSLRRMDSQRKGLRVSFAFFQRNYLPDWRANERVATVEEFGDLWKPGAIDGIPPFVMNGNCI